MTLGPKRLALLEVPDAMRDATSSVLRGEYEAGFSGERLSILDIGANVGAFCVWANQRWPCSMIHAYEPHPATFAMLRRNVAEMHNVIAHNVAVYPGAQDHAAYFARYDGDGEGGLVECMRRTFTDIPTAKTFPVTVLHPSQLPMATIVKLDVEGAESAILRAMDLSGTSLILLEYQDDANRVAIKDLLREGFVLEHEDSYRWDDLLPDSAYRPALAGDHFGLMFFSGRRPSPLRRWSLWERIVRRLARAG